MHTLRNDRPILSQGGAFLLGKRVLGKDVRAHDIKFEVMLAEKQQGETAAWSFMYGHGGRKRRSLTEPPSGRAP
jgi:hypothetical protein